MVNSAEGVKRPVEERKYPREPERAASIPRRRRVMAMGLRR